VTEQEKQVFDNLIALFKNRGKVLSENEDEICVKTCVDQIMRIRPKENVIVLERDPDAKAKCILAHEDCRYRLN
jgi:hypothetical protein